MFEQNLNALQGYLRKQRSLAVAMLMLTSEVVAVSAVPGVADFAVVATSEPQPYGLHYRY